MHLLFVWSNSAETEPLSLLEGKHLQGGQLKKPLYVHFHIANMAFCTFPTGFTWRDDYTQHVMAQELANLPKTYPRHPEASSSARYVDSVDHFLLLSRVLPIMSITLCFFRGWWCGAVMYQVTHHLPGVEISESRDHYAQ